MTTVSEVQKVKLFGDQKRLRGLLIVLLVLGIGFRFIHLDRKIYWHDEVYTSFRAAGWTRGVIDQALFQNRLMAAPSLQKFQQIKPDSTVADTVQSLRLEDPQHPPLYFVMARLWMQQWGSSITASRLLPALISLISLPLMYGLAMALFHHRLTALLATTLLALSPFDILFAQTARQYSLLTAVVIGSSWLLLQMMRRPRQNWIYYGVSAAVGLYTHPFFALTSVGHAVYVAGLALWPDRVKATPTGWQKLQDGWRDPRLLYFCLANFLALLLFSPWISVLLSNHGRASATTDWTRAATSIWILVKLWVLSFTALFFDLDFGFSNPVTFLLRLPFVLLIGAALYAVCRHTPRATSLFIFSSILVPFLLLVIPDLILGGKRSTVSRYLISCFPAVQLAVAFLLAKHLTFRKPIWTAVLALTLASSMLSCKVSAMAETWWSKDLSYLNAEVIHRTNALANQSPVLVSDMGDDYTNTGDLVSLSYGLDPSIRLFLIGSPLDWTPLANESTILTFRPSENLEAAIAQQGWRLEPVFEDGKLWQIVR